MEKIQINTSPLKDKSLWLAILMPMVLMLAKVFKVDLPQENVSQVLDLVLAFILGSKGSAAVKALAVAKMEGDKARAAAVAPTVSELVNK